MTGGWPDPVDRSIAGDHHRRMATTTAPLDFELPVARSADERADLLSLDAAGLAALMARLGEKPFRARQVFAWLHSKRVTSIAAMTDLSAALRQRLDSEAARLISALAADRRPVTLPRVEAEHLRVRPVLAPDDPALEALLTATLDEVGARGFDDATTAGISRAAGHSEGLLFSRYQSKLELFLDACEVQRRPGFEANEAFLSRLTASRGRGVAEAVLIREFMHPDAEGPRTLTLEQVRVAWHDTRLRDSLTRQAEEFVNSLRESPTGVPAGRDPVAYFHLATAIGLGLVLLPRLDPEAWRLPYDVMTVPLEGE